MTDRKTERQLVRQTEIRHTKIVQRARRQKGERKTDIRREMVVLVPLVPPPPPPPIVETLDI